MLERMILPHIPFRTVRLNVQQYGMKKVDMHTFIKYTESIIVLE